MMFPFAASVSSVIEAFDYAALSKRRSKTGA